MNRTAAEPGGRLPYPPSDYGYVWYDNGDGMYYADTRDGQVTLHLDTHSPGQISWTAEDDMGVVERGNFSGMSAANLDGVLYRADRLLAEFDTRPVIPPKTDSYNQGYSETFPGSYPAPDFRW